MREKITYFVLGTLCGWTVSLFSLPPGKVFTEPPAKVVVVHITTERAVVSPVQIVNDLHPPDIINQVRPAAVTVTSPDVHLGAMQIEAKFPAVKIIVDSVPAGHATITPDDEAERVRLGMERFMKSMGLDQKGELLPKPKGE